jgi:hypothetical protein
MQEVNAANRLKHQGRIRELMFIQAGPVDQREVPPLWGVYTIFDATTNFASALEQVKRVVVPKLDGPEAPEAPPTDTPIAAPIDAPIAEIQRSLLGTAPGAVCPRCSTFNPLDDVRMIAWMSQVSLFDSYVHARCKKCAHHFRFLPPTARP